MFVDIPQKTFIVQSPKIERSYHKQSHYIKPLLCELFLLEKNSQLAPEQLVSTMLFFGHEYFNNLLGNP